MPRDYLHYCSCVSVFVHRVSSDKGLSDRHHLLLSGNVWLNESLKTSSKEWFSRQVQCGRIFFEATWSPVAPSGRRCRRTLRSCQKHHLVILLRMTPKNSETFVNTMLALHSIQFQIRVYYGCLSLLTSLLAFFSAWSKRRRLNRLKTSLGGRQFSRLLQQK